MSYITIYRLENCGYSSDAINILEQYNIKHKIINVKYSDKEKYKNKDSSTFPIIYLNVKNNKYFIGGYTELNYIANLVKQKNKNIINILIKKYNFEKKIILRLIKLFLD